MDVHTLCVMQHKQIKKCEAGLRARAVSVLRHWCFVEGASVLHIGGVEVCIFRTSCKGTSIR